MTISPQFVWDIVGVGHFADLDILLDSFSRWFTWAKQLSLFEIIRAYCLCTFINFRREIHNQCLKLRVRPRRTIPTTGAQFSALCTRCAHIYLREQTHCNTKRQREKLQGAHTVVKCLHPLGAENITLISNTDNLANNMWCFGWGFSLRYIITTSGGI